MSIGNLRDSGNQSNNFPWQLKMLLGQQCACDQLTEIVANTDDVEFLLTAILTTLQAGTEFEAKFVLETCPGAPPTTRVLLEVRIWNTDTSTWEPPQYYLPGSNVPVTIAPGCTLEYTDPTGVLAMIYNELLAQTIILTDIEADTTSIDGTLTNLFAAYSAGQQACASSLSVTLCTEQGTDLANIDTNTGNIDTKLTSVTRTPGIIRTVGPAGTIAPLVYDFSVSNVGSGNGLILGVTIKPGETLNFTAGALNNSYAANTITYNGTGTELVIIYNA